MEIAGWDDDDDDSFLCDEAWEAQEAQLIANRRAALNNGVQLANQQPPAQGWPPQPPAPQPVQQNFAAMPQGYNYCQPAQSNFGPPQRVPGPPPMQQQQQQQQQPSWQQQPGDPSSVRSIFFSKNTAQPPQHAYPQHQQQQMPIPPHPHPQQPPPPWQWQQQAPPPNAYYQPYQYHQPQLHCPGEGPNSHHPQQQVAAPPPARCPPPPPAVCTVYGSLKLFLSTSSVPGSRNTNNQSNNVKASSSTTAMEKPVPLLEVDLNYHQSTHNALQRLGNGTWNPRTRSWLFPLSSHDQILEALQNAPNVRAQVDPLHSLPATVLRCSGAICDDSSRYCHIPTNLEVQLMSFQRDGVKFGLQHGGRALIGDEMGLGKTVQAIALAAAYRDEWPGLVIAPSSLREQWADALHRWLGITENKIFIVNNGKDAKAGPETGNRFFNCIELDGKYNVVIVDESHYIKDPTAKRTKAALPILKNAKRCFMLTGTPALNRPKEIYTQLSALVPNAKFKMKDFGERYCKGTSYDRYGGAQNLGELHTMLRGSVMVRRLKSEVLSELPKKRRQQVFLSLDADARKELSGLQKQLDGVKALVGQLAAANAASGGAVSLGGGRMEENRAIMEMYRRTAEIKAKSVQDYVDMLLDAGQKFLIFAHHKELMDAIEHTCNRKKNCRHIRIDGSTPATDRGRLVHAFQDNDDVRVAILSIKAAGVGLTLTAASTVVFAEMTWTPGEIIQAEDRAHRIGQASAVNVYFLHVRGSVDEIIWNAIQNKLENVGQALDGQDRAMEVAAARTMPEKGQLAMDSFVKVQGNNPTGDAPPLALQPVAATSSAGNGGKQQNVKQWRDGQENEGVLHGGAGLKRSREEQEDEFYIVD